MGLAGEKIRLAAFIPRRAGGAATSAANGENGRPPLARGSTSAAIFEFVVIETRVPITTNNELAGEGIVEKSSDIPNRIRIFVR